MKPYIHAESSAKQFGGKPEDYLEIHNWFDSSKAFIIGPMHRAMYHHTAGIFLAEKLFGVVITNSEGKKISVRDVGEQHVLEDFRGKFIPTPQDYLQEVNVQGWMNNGDGYPPSYTSLTREAPKKEPKKQKTVAIDSGDILPAPFDKPMPCPGPGTAPIVPYPWPPHDQPYIWPKDWKTPTVTD